MHKKSVESSHTSPGKAGCLSPPLVQETMLDKAMEDEKQKQSRHTSSSVSREELRENSIAVLRAKALEHSVKMLETVSDKANSHTTQREEAEDQESEDEMAEVEKSN